MRVLAAITLFLTQTIAAQAAITSEELRQMAYAGDVDGLEQGLAEAHQQSLAGEITYDELRDMVIALTVSHPEIWQTTTDWIEAYPDSPYANSLRAFQYNALAWDRRGSGPARRKRRETLADFAMYQEWAMDHAQIAFDAGPDYVPASDAVFRLQATTKRYSRWTILSMISLIMETQPNIGSLKRASTMTQRGWGGRGQRDIILLCEEHAQKVPDETYDVDICIYHLTREFWASEEEMAYADRRLGNKTHPAIEWALSYAITVGSSGRRSREDALIVENYLRGQGYRDYEMVWRYVRTFYQRIEQTEPLVRDVVNAAIKHARAEIVHDPLNPDLLDVLQRRDPVFSSVESDYQYDYNSPNRHIFNSRWAAIRPYSSAAWLRIARAISLSEDQETARGAVPYFINGIYYSDHSYGAMKELLRYQYDAWWTAQHDGVIGPYLGEDRENAEIWMCPVIHLTRLIDAKCEADDESIQNCTKPLPGYRAAYRGLLDVAREEGLCRAELQSNIRDLYFSPIPVELENLADPLVFED